MQTISATVDPMQQWWGHSRHHGWVVLDRTMAVNQPGGTQPLFFCRVKDGHCFFEPRKAWNPPAYCFAPEYLKGLPADRAQMEADTLSTLQGTWSELQAGIQRQFAEASTGDGKPADGADSK